MLKNIVYLLLFAPLCANIHDNLGILAEALSALSRKKERPLITYQEFQPATFFTNPSDIKTRKGESILAKGYIQDCNNYFKENSKIPPLQPNVFRIATYNIHYWSAPKITKNAYANVEKIMQTIHALQATALVLQEAHGKITIKNRLSPAFLEKGYKDYVWCQGYYFDHASFGNALLSKQVLTSKLSKEYTEPSETKEKRCFVNGRTTLMPSKATLSIYGTHLDVWDETANTRDQEIKELLKEISTDASDIIIIAGDFNAFRKQDYPADIWQKILQSTASHIKKTIAEIPQNTLQPILDAGFQDSFTFSGQSGPLFTSWTGTVIDFIFIKDQRTEQQKQERPLNTKSYVYYSPASDHLPIICDLEIL